MKRTLIVVTLAVLGFGASADFANPTPDTSPTPVWRQAPEATDAQPQFEQKRPTITFERVVSAEGGHPLCTA